MADFWLLISDCWFLTANFWQLEALYWFLPTDFWLLTASLSLWNVDNWRLITDFWLLANDYWQPTKDFRSTSSEIIILTADHLPSLTCAIYVPSSLPPITSSPSHAPSLPHTLDIFPLNHIWSGITTMGDFTVVPTSSSSTSSPGRCLWPTEPVYLLLLCPSRNSCTDTPVLSSSAVHLYCSLQLYWHDLSGRSWSFQTPEETPHRPPWLRFPARGCPHLCNVAVSD